MFYYDYVIYDNNRADKCERVSVTGHLNQLKDDVKVITERP